MSRVLLAITGASGVRYGVRALQRLVEAGVATDLVVSAAARRVLALEEHEPADPLRWVADLPGPPPRLLDDGDIAAPPASGSSGPTAMLVIPCSMGTVGRLAAGLSGTLIERSADVMLKERRPLVLVPREAPLSTLHLRNLLTLSELGVRIVPAMPAFYHLPATIEDMVAFVVDRALQSADLPLPLRHPWRAPGHPEPAP